MDKFIPKWVIMLCLAFYFMFFIPFWKKFKEELENRGVNQNKIEKGEIIILIALIVLILIIGLVGK